jgi:phosphohistidine swiveling domain-containing protein
MVRADAPWGAVPSPAGGFDVTTTEAVVFPGPEEIEGFWALDKMHAPRPVTPLSFDLVIHTLAEGFTKAQAEYDCPIMVTNKEVNHYMYAAFHPVPDEAVLADRMTRYHDKLAEKVPGVGRTWEETWKPDVRAKNEALKTADYSGLSDAELVAKLDEFTEHMRYQWWIHGHINFVLLSSSAFCDLYDKIIQPSDPTEAYQTLQGFHTRSVDASQGLWDLSRVAKASPALSELFRTTSPAEVLAALDTTDEGKDFRRRLDEYLHEYGWRHDAVYDLADIPWREDPSIPLASIAGLLELDDGESPDALYRRSKAQRERLLGALREKLADDPDTMKKLDELYEAAQFSFPLTEDHAFYIDQLGIGVFRRFVLEIGSRLASKGVIAAPDDVFFLYRDELVDALTTGGDRRPLVAERRESFARAAEVIPPGALGTPPPPPETPDPFMDALVGRLLGVVPAEENTDPNMLQGVAGSPGRYTGTARVVRSLAEASDLEEGEIMVCEMTLPPWVPLFSIAGAVVTDVGGVLSHSAIVAREFDLPAVVGTQVGTVVIRSGQTLTVDGTKGRVYLDGRD